MSAADKDVGHKDNWPDTFKDTLCPTCKYWDRHEGLDDDYFRYGLCRINPPTPTHSGTWRQWIPPEYRYVDDNGFAHHWASLHEASSSAWPITTHEDWCGKFENGD